MLLKGTVKASLVQNIAMTNQVISYMIHVASHLL